MSTHFPETPTIPPSALTPAADVLGAINYYAGSLPQVELDYVAEICTLWVTLKPAPKPVFNLSLGDSVRKIQAAIIALWGQSPQSPVKFLAYRGTGPVFTLGGDLDFYLECLAKNDRSGLAAYARLATELINLNASSLGNLAITLSTIHAKALGGGIDPARACNIMIAEESARFGYPEVAFNHYPITAVAILSRRIGVLEAQQILMSAREYSATEFYQKGILDAVVPDGTGQAWITDYATKSLATHSARLGLFSAFHRRAGDLELELTEAAMTWVDHIFRLKPLDIAKLQKIAHMQDRMMARTARMSAASASRLQSLEA